MMNLNKTYETIKSDSLFEVRNYASLSLAKVLVSGPFETARVNGKALLCNYLGGNNYKKAKINKTISFMMLPQMDGWEVSCVLPEKYLYFDPPRPVGSNIQFEQLHPRTVAVYHFRGRPAYASMMRKSEELRKWASTLDFKFHSSPRIVVYSTSIFSFMRKNEIQIDRIN